MGKNNKFAIIGKVSPQELYVYSESRPLALDEYFVIEDDFIGNQVGEIIEALTYPFMNKDMFYDRPDVFETLKRNVSNHDNPVHVGKLRIIMETSSPVEASSTIREPNFSEIEDILIKKSPADGFVLGTIRSTENFQDKLPESFKNVSPMFDSEEGVTSQNGIPFVLDHYSLREYPHIGLFGGSGSGKTFGLRVICEEIMQKRIPGIVLDPHYELVFADEMPGLPEENKYNYSSRHEIFQVGVNVGIKFTDLNSGELCSLMEFMGDMSQPMRGAIDALFGRGESYTTLLNKINGLKQAFEVMEQPQHKRENMDSDISVLYVRYKDKVAGLPTLQAISWRLDQLMKMRIFDADITMVERCIMKRRLAVVRGKQLELKMISSYLISKLYHKRRTYRDWAQVREGGANTDYIPDKFPPFYIIMDEAHNFAPNSNFTNPTKQILREISQEARKYGVFEILGTQRPSLVDPTIMAQLNTKIIFRTGIESDMQMIKTETNLTEQQMMRLPNLSSGNAFISSATLSKTMYVKFRSVKTVSPHSLHPFDELDEFDFEDRMKTELAKFLPLGADTIPMVHSDINKAVKKSLSIKEIISILDDMADEGIIKKEKSPFGCRYI